MGLLVVSISVTVSHPLALNPSCMARGTSAAEAILQWGSLQLKGSNGRV